MNESSMKQVEANRRAAMASSNPARYNDTRRAFCRMVAGFLADDSEDGDWTTKDIVHGMFKDDALESLYLKGERPQDVATDLLDEGKTPGDFIETEK